MWHLKVIKVLDAKVFVLTFYCFMLSSNEIAVIYIGLSVYFELHVQ